MTLTPQQTQVFFFLVLMGAFYFLIIRPQQKRVKQHAKLISEIKAGEKVITIGGLYGQITALKENVVTLKLADKIEIKIARDAIARRQEDAEEEKKPLAIGGKK